MDLYTVVIDLARVDIMNQGALVVIVPFIVLPFRDKFIKGKFWPRRDRRPLMIFSDTLVSVT